MGDETLLTTRLQVPTIRAGTVPRPRLISAMSDGLRRGRRLTLVSAPPGFGKTTLIRQWVEALGRPAAWLTLEAGDNDPMRFMRYVTAALNRADERIAQSFARAASGSPHELLVHLINDLAGAGEVLLVLDDYHVIGDFAIHDLLTYLLAHQPPGFHLVIGAREDPALALARMRARDEITEVREAALRFNRGEADDFLNRSLGLQLSPRAVETLAARTEGWITALQLASLALARPGAGSPDRGAGDTDAFITAFAGNDRYVVDYFMEEVLQRVGAEVREFLRQTCILNRLTAPLCDAVTGKPGSQAILERLEATNTFVVSLDNTRRWFRYHVLFAEALRFTLSPAAAADLHQKAAAWFEACGEADQAAYHRRAGARDRLPGERVRAALPAQPLVEPLSDREVEVLRLIAAGDSNADIARKLYITVGTVKRHLNNIYGKLEAGSRTQAVARAREVGLLE